MAFLLRRLGFYFGAFFVAITLNFLIPRLMPGDPATRILLSLAVRDGRAVAQVSDNGHGVPREEHERLFRRLYRREASRSQPGYGLGLSLVSAIAELHGAAVRLLDGARPGLMVEISFPLAPPLVDTEKP